jgi:hypothetical protein
LLKENFTNWTSKNKQIDNLIQEMQLSINDHRDTIFEWIPYDQINIIKELSNTTYLARWKNGPLSYRHHYDSNEYIRNSANKEVILKYLVDSQNNTNEFLHEVCKFFSYKLIQLFFYYILIFF